MAASSEPIDGAPAAGRVGWPGWAPLAGTTVAVLAVGNRLPPWLFMWGLAGAIFGGLKWLSWWEARRRGIRAPLWRSVAYLSLWPGMDARTFLRATRCRPPGLGEWAMAVAKTAGGALLFWGAARMLAANPLAAGWVGMLGLVMILHFGGFHLISLCWRAAGVDARPIMDAPLTATSLGDFWGRRWNLAFHVLARDFILGPLRSRVGARLATFSAFLASGLIHDLVISVPAGGGYGLPTAYFALQGFGLWCERSPLGTTLGLGRGLRGRLFAAGLAAGPAVGLFHPPFVMRVFIPFMRAMGAL